MAIAIYCCYKNCDDFISLTSSHFFGVSLRVEAEAACSHNQQIIKKHKEKTHDKTTKTNKKIDIEVYYNRIYSFLFTIPLSR